MKHESEFDHEPHASTRTGGVLFASTIVMTDDLLALMPRAVDLVWQRGSGPVQCDETGETLPVPLLHFALPLDDKSEALQFLRDHGKHVACYRLDPHGEGVLMIGLRDDGEAKRIAREEFGVEVQEGLFGQIA